MATIETRPNSTSITGAAFGDEGKGKVTCDQVIRFAQESEEVIVYGPNGGANAGHTIELPDGRRIFLHQLTSGVLTENATLVLGKGKVLHPGDLIEEVRQVEAISGEPIKADIWIDEKALLSLDTHRAYEDTLKRSTGAGKGAACRGIAPAYADYYLRQALQVRDLVNFDVEKLTSHYQHYAELFHALMGTGLSRFEVATLKKERKVPVGSLDEFLSRLSKERDFLLPFSRNVVELMR